MSTTHTPGPWEITEYKEGESFDGLYILSRENNPQPNGNWRMVCQISEWSNHDKIDEANAKRIVDCVNAMEGIEDPKVHLSHLAYQIEKAKQERNVAEEKYEDLKEAVRSLIQDIDNGLHMKSDSVIVEALRQAIQ